MRKRNNNPIMLLLCLFAYGAHGATYSFTNGSLIRENGSNTLYEANPFGTTQLFFLGPGRNASGTYTPEGDRLHLAASHTGNGTSVNPIQPAGPTRIGLYHPEEIDNFEATIDVVHQGLSGNGEGRPLHFLIGRSNYGAGYAYGPILFFGPKEGGGAEFGLGFLEVSNRIIPYAGADNVTASDVPEWSTSKHYKLQIIVSGDTMMGSVWDLAAPDKPLATLVRKMVPDAYFRPFRVGYWISNRPQRSANEMEAPISATIDNFTVIPRNSTNLPAIHPLSTGELEWSKSEDREMYVETATSLGGPWTPVDAVPSENGGNWRLPVSGPHQPTFFRLRSN